MAEGSRNARAEAGIANQLKAGGFMGVAPAALVRPGNTEDDLARAGEADWVIEAVIEDLGIKRALFARLAPILKPGAVMSSNTSTIPLAQLVDGQDAAFAERFVISHFFNPPRRMALLELVGAPGSAAMAFAARAGRLALGKTIVDCRDTPGFIANRVGCTWMSIAMTEAVRLGLGVEQADAVHGAMGLPPTGVFGLADLVGIDIIPHVWGSLMRALPAGDAINRFDLPALPVVQALLAAKRFGRKTRAGFCRGTGADPREVIDLATGEYQPATGFTVADLPGRGRDLNALICDASPLGAYARAVVGGVIRYAAQHCDRIAGDPALVDTAIELGYAWRAGPFKILATLTAEARAAAGLTDLPPLAAPAMRRPVEASRLDRARLGKPLVATGAASLWPLGDGLACLDIETRMGAISAGVLDAMDQTLALLGRPVRALVVGNGDPRAFSAGADLTAVLALIEAGDTAGLDAFVRRGQGLFAALRAAPVPSVAALAGQALGGGCELAMHCSATVAHAETRIGLPEHSLGLLPAWGGCTRLLASAEPAMRKAGPVAGLKPAFAALTLPRPAGSAREAAGLGLTEPTQGIVMFDGDVLAAAIARAEALLPGYAPPKPQGLRAAGASAREGLLADARARQAAGGLAVEDLAIAERIAWVLTGGDAPAGTELTEAALRDLEREAFLALAAEPAARRRIGQLLSPGKPRRA